jgi:hypothetical protein
MRAVSMLHQSNALPALVTQISSRETDTESRTMPR